jgi:hypothetical protein
MSLPSRLLGANPSIQVSTLLTGSLSTPSAKGAFVETDYVSLGTTLVATNTTTISFTSIPTTYKLLELRIVARSSAGDAGFGLKFNNDTTDGNYAWQRNYYAASDSSTGSSYAGQMPTSSQDANHFGVALIQIWGADNSTQYTSWMSFGGNKQTSGGFNPQLLGVWKNTAQVSSVQVTCDTQGSTSQFAPNTRISLYGLR